MRKGLAFYWLLIAMITPVLLSAQNEKGHYYNRVKCKSDTSQEYALFVPAKYVAEKNAPLLIILDPAARGDVPVEMYHLLAEEYGVIIAGSYNSRNFSGASSEGSFAAVYNDIVKQYDIDAQKVWIAGFSGGARAASAIGIAYPEIRGIVASGAGFASDDGISKENIAAYAAIVGEDDMNYGELMDNSNYLDEKKINNILLTFSGDHQWAPVNNFGLALEWLFTRDSVLPATDRGDAFLKSINTKFRNGFLYTAWMDAQQLGKIPAYKKVTDSIMQVIEKSKDFNANKENFRIVMVEEQNCMNDFSLSFSSMITEKEIGEEKDWNKKANRVKNMRTDKNPYSQIAGKRCFGHYTRSCMEYYFQFLEASDFDMAFKIAKVFSFLTPEDAVPFYYMAKAKAAVGNKKQSEKLLVEAVKKGLLIDKQVLQDDLLLKVFSTEEIKEFSTKK